MEHYALQEKMRGYYAKWIAKAVNEPHYVLTIIVDKLDRYVFLTPHHTTPLLSHSFFASFVVCLALKLDYHAGLMGVRHRTHKTREW